MNEKKRGALADLGLAAVAVIWGTGFSAVQYALDAGLSPLFILALRFTLAALVLAVAFWRQIASIPAAQWRLGGVAGLLLCLAFLCQTLAQKSTTPSNSAFLTTTNVLFVPFLLWIFERKRPAAKSLLLPLLTVAGVFLLSYTPGQGISFNRGDSLALLCALLFAGHIAFVGHAVRRVEAVRLTFMQMATAAALSLLGFLLLDRGGVSREALAQGMVPVLYLGLFSTCLCFFLQTWAQRYADSAKAAIFLSMEGLFGSLFSVLLGLEPFRWTLAVGGLMIFASALLTELPVGRAAGQEE